MRQRTARPNSGAPVADPGSDPGALTDAAADADQGAHGAAACGDAGP
jgi:hypothetical protein